VTRTSQTIRAGGAVTTALGAVLRLARGPRLLAGRVQELIPRLRPRGVPECGRIVALPEAITARRWGPGPAARAHSGNEGRIARTLLRDSGDRFGKECARSMLAAAMPGR
jgi:hypothetical protein